MIYGDKEPLGLTSELKVSTVSALDCDDCGPENLRKPAAMYVDLPKPLFTYEAKFGIWVTLILTFQIYS